jgi:hypothetical protein
MSSSSSTSKAPNSKPDASEKKDNKNGDQEKTEKDTNNVASHIGMLEEDDEFEEFPTAGEAYASTH